MMMADLDQLTACEMRFDWALKQYERERKINRFLMKALLDISTMPVGDMTEAWREMKALANVALFNGFSMMKAEMIAGRDE